MEVFLFPSYVTNNKDLSINARFVYCHFLHLVDADNCFHGNINNLGDVIGFTKRQTQTAIKELFENGWIKKVAIEDFPELMKEKGLQGMGKGNLVCAWCEIKTNVLDEHHYPVPASKGGQEVVSICPNCHGEFHRISDIYIATF